MNKQLEQQTQQLNRQAQQLNHQALILIGQIRMFSGENYPPEKCAAMLMADPTVIKAVYAQIQDSPDMDDASILEALNSRQSLTPHKNYCQISHFSFIPRYPLALTLINLVDA